MQNICLLGATGSIGESTLDIIARHPDRYRLQIATAATNVDAMTAICLQFNPEFAVMVEADAAQRLQSNLRAHGNKTNVLSGQTALVDAAESESIDTVMAAIVGAAGLPPTLAAVQAGKKVLLANKEALVVSGQLFIDAVKSSGAMLLPIDSEHNAIFQCLNQGKVDSSVSKILLTGSGGPFLHTPLEQLPTVTPEQAVAHPNWTMGKKISVDSATMMNKGLEFIEAKWLFDLCEDDIEIIIHPQSVIHSMVQYCDGSVIAQMGRSDMRTPIAHAMAYPQRVDSGVAPLDFSELQAFSFCKPDYQRYPNLKLAIEACRSGQEACTILNAANEVAVAAFLNNEIKFTEIAKINEFSLENAVLTKTTTISQLIELDRIARESATRALARLR